MYDCSFAQVHICIQNEPCQCFMYVQVSDRVHGQVQPMHETVILVSLRPALPRQSKG